VRNRYRRLSDQWKATLRTAAQSVIGFTGLFVLAALNEAVGLLSGGSIEDAMTNLSTAGTALLIGMVGVATSIVTFAMNRPGAKAHASYSDSDRRDE
jgi:hypothetical protein